MPTSSANTPGVQINEVQLTGPPIIGTGTSTAAFVGAAPTRGQFTSQVRLVTSPDQFNSDYIGNATISTQLSWAVLGFFANGGGLCYVVNVDSSTASTSALPAPEPTASDAVAGIALLATQDDVRIIAAPGQTDPTVYSALIGQAELLGDRFAILDPTAKVSDRGLLTTSPSAGSGGVRPPDSEYAAFYYSRILVGSQLKGDPANAFVAPSGHIAGVYASVDNNPGVFKAPANAVISGALGVEDRLTDADQNALNPVGVNILRVFNGNVTLWGARTLSTTNPLFRYISTRRLVNYIETSLQTGLQWAVFEPNNLVLQQQIIRAVRGFLNGVWADGALFGTTADDAYYVRFPPLLNTDANRAAGQLTVEIGLRVTFPAEFVIINIGVILNSPISA